MKNLLSVLVLALGIFVCFSASAESVEIDALPAMTEQHYLPVGIYTPIPNEILGVGLGAYPTFESIAIVPTACTIGGRVEVGWRDSKRD